VGELRRLDLASRRAVDRPVYGDAGGIGGRRPLEGVVTVPTASSAGPALPGRYTWTCFDCPVWAEEYWPDRAGAEAAAAVAASAHRGDCAAAGRLLVVPATGDGHPDRIGAERLIGAYDPDELMVVPAWTVHMSRALAGFIANHGSRRLPPLDLHDPAHVYVLAAALLAADPRPGYPRPTDMTELAALLKELRDTLTAALPRP
jgi:hypothetical protein